MRASGLIRNIRQLVFLAQEASTGLQTVYCVCHKEEGTSSTLSQHCYRSEVIFDSCKNEEIWISEFKGIMKIYRFAFSNVY